MAASLNHKKVVRILLEAGADGTIVNDVSGVAAVVSKALSPPSGMGTLLLPHLLQTLRARTWGPQGWT